MPIDEVTLQKHGKKSAVYNTQQCRQAAIKVLEKDSRPIVSIAISIPNAASRHVRYEQTYTSYARKKVT